MLSHLAREARLGGGGGLSDPALVLGLAVRQGGAMPPPQRCPRPACLAPPWWEQAPYEPGAARAYGHNVHGGCWGPAQVCHQPAVGTVLLDVPRGCQRLAWVCHRPAVGTALLGRASKQWQQRSTRPGMWGLPLTETMADKQGQAKGKKKKKNTKQCKAAAPWCPQNHGPSLELSAGGQGGGRSWWLAQGSGGAHGWSRSTVGPLEGRRTPGCGAGGGVVRARLLTFLWGCLGAVLGCLLVGEGGGDPSHRRAAITSQLAPGVSCG